MTTGITVVQKEVKIHGLTGLIKLTNGSSKQRLVL